MVSALKLTRHDMLFGDVTSGYLSCWLKHWEVVLAEPPAEERQRALDFASHSVSSADFGGRKDDAFAFLTYVFFCLFFTLVLTC